MDIPTVKGVSFSEHGKKTTDFPNMVNIYWNAITADGTAHATTGIQTTYNGHAIETQHPNFGQINYRNFKYYFAQLHLHSKSEHALDGKLNDGEVHLVHVKEGATSGAFIDGDLLVLGFFFKFGATASSFLDSAFAFDQTKYPNFVTTGTQSGTKQTLDNGTKIDMKTYLDSTIKNSNFYHYKGSLTTPPCTEVVEWFVFEDPLPMNQAQYDAFEKLVPSPQNNRPTFPKGDRKVAYNTDFYFDLTSRSLHSHNGAFSIAASGFLVAALALFNFVFMM